MKQVLIMLLTLLSVTAYADDIALGEPEFGGTGCPEGTVSTVLSGDNKILSIIFDAYVAEAGKTKSIARKACDIGVPVHVPQGLSFSVLKVDYRGYNFLPKGATSRMSVEYFFGGSVGPKTSRNFSGPLDDDYLVTHKLGLNALVWSPCGKDTVLRIKSSIQNKTNLKKEDALTTVDSADVKAGMEYHIQWRKC